MIQRPGGLEWFLGQCLAFLPRTRKIKERCFFLDLWKWQTNGTITRPSHESRIVYWFLRICHGSILSILSLHDLNCSSFLNTKTRHTCQCRVWYFQHLHRCQDLCVDQQLGPGIGGQEPQNPELRPSQLQKTSFHINFKYFWAPKKLKSIATACLFKRFVVALRTKKIKKMTLNFQNAKKKWAAFPPVS